MYVMEKHGDLTDREINIIKSLSGRTILTCTRPGMNLVEANSSGDKPRNSKTEVTAVAKKKHRNCEKCIAFCNMLKGRDYRCGLGFQVMEEMESGDGFLRVVVHPFEDECESISLPNTKEEFVKTAAELVIKWDIDEVVTMKESISGW